MMNERVAEQPEKPRRPLMRMRVLTPAVALVAGSMALVWACAPRTAPAIDASAATAALRMTPPAVPAVQQAQPEAQPAPAPAPQPTSLAQLDAQMATAMRMPTEAEVERRIEEEVARRTAERVREATARAFPVRERIEMSSTMYCLKGHMRTGVRTRDGMAAGDPRVLPLGSVVRVSHPDGRLIGIFTIMDTGGAIRGNKIDLYVDSCREAIRWGRAPVVTEVLGIGMQR
jgi:3D (Asp-Asp-Asp) domain-containing protein